MQGEHSGTKALRTPNDRRVGSAYVKAIFGGKSDMWIWRKVNSGFLPQPEKINRQNAWLQSDIHRIALVPLSQEAGT